MIIQNSEALRSWLTTCLSRMCDADPGALAKYILALVKKDKTPTELRAFCYDQLDVFLMSQTKAFVDLLFEALQTKSYLSSDTPEVPSNDNISVSSPPPLMGSSDVTDPSPLVNPERSPGRSKTLGSSVKIRSRNDSPDKSHRSRENAGSRRKRVQSDDKHFPSKKPRTSKHSKGDHTHHSKVGEEKSKEESKKSDKGNCKFGTSRSRSNSFDKANSSQSSSRSRSREKSIECDTSDLKKVLTKIDHQKIPHAGDHGDTDYRQKQICGVTTLKVPNYPSKESKRCQDYDEKGYCLKGDLCPFDHGTDPILVEDVSALNFSSDQFEGESSPLPPLPTTSPPVPPPPPPLPPPGSYVPEPYNPEAPGMNILPRNQMNFWLPPVHHIPPPPPHMPLIPPTASSIPNMMWNEPSFHNTKQQRIRELIGIPTVDSSSMELDKGRNKDTCKNNANNDVTYSKSFSSATREHSVNQPDFKPKGFDFSRLGPCPRKSTNFNGNRNILEIRKIPKHLNSIANLNRHFSKFGNIVNLQVGYDNDHEAALITFLTHAEATAAYRSTEPILNNRFIKVFWNNNNNNDNGTSSTFAKDISPISTSETNIPDVPPIRSISKDTNQDILHGKYDKVIEKPKVTVPRSVYVSSHGLKKKTFLALTAAKKLKDQRKGAIQKKLQLHSAKTEFIKSQIEHQKIILEKLKKAKNEKEKEFLKKTIQTMTTQISDLQHDLKKESEELKSHFKGAQVGVSKTAAEKELLDAELDLYNKQHTGDEDTAELVVKVNELKNKAKALGLIDSTSPQPFLPGMASRRHSNSRYPQHGSVSSLSVDHRPRKLLVVCSQPTNRERLTKHFKQFGDIQKVDEVAGGFVFTFSTRMEAEAAYCYGSKFGDNILSIAWFNDPQLCVTQNPEFNNENPVLKTMDPQTVEVEEEEEDEEEDSEARSWRR